MRVKDSFAQTWMAVKDFISTRRRKHHSARKDDQSEKENKNNRAKTGKKDKSLLSLARRHLDKNWYADLHKVSDPINLEKHFIEYGLPRGYAPSPEFSNSEGMLTTWGSEYFARLGVPVGQAPADVLPPDDCEATRPFSVVNEKRKPLAVVSTSFGDENRLLPVIGEWAQTTDFLLLTDRKFDSPGCWQYLHANYFHVNSRRRAAFFKTHLPTYFEEYERVLWVDGDVLICRDPHRTLLEYGVWGHDFATFPHRPQGNPMAEAATYVRLGKEDPRRMGVHLGEFRGHPAFEKLNTVDTAVMMINPRSEAARKLSATWWTHIMRGSKRDELSLPLAIHDTPDISWDVFPEESFETSSSFVKVAY